MQVRLSMAQNDSMPLVWAWPWTQKTLEGVWTV